MAVDAMVINPDLESRMRFKHAATSIGMFKSLQLTSSLQEGMQRLSTNHNCDVLYVSLRYDLPIVNGFIQSAKQTGQGMDSAYLLTLGAQDQTAETLASSMIGGTDGFLVEPFSVESLIESTQLAAKLKKERKDTRQRAAIALLVSKAIETIDEGWKNGKFGVPNHQMLRRLSSLTDTVREMSAEHQRLYHELLIDQFIEAGIPALPEMKYTGASVRVRARMLKKMH